MDPLQAPIQAMCISDTEILWLGVGYLLITSPARVSVDATENVRKCMIHCGARYLIFGAQKSSPPIPWLCKALASVEIAMDISWICEHDLGGAITLRWPLTMDILKDADIMLAAGKEVGQETPHAVSTPCKHSVH